MAAAHLAFTSLDRVTVVLCVTVVYRVTVVYLVTVVDDSVTVVRFL